ncbi:ankyrin repeat-containing domain protein, partial [Jimgerdemannia flammicorona]
FLDITLIGVLKDSSHITGSTVDLLLKFGASAKALSANGDSALHWAMNAIHYGNHIDIIHVLLEQGACANQQNGDGMTPLHYICSVNDKEIDEVISMFLKHGADINSTTGTNCNTPLSTSVMLGCYKKTIRSLYNFGANIDHINGINGYTPLHYAVIQKSTSNIMELLRTGASCNYRDTRKGNTPLLMMLDFDCISWAIANFCLTRSPKPQHVALVDDYVQSDTKHNNTIHGAPLTLPPEIWRMVLCELANSIDQSEFLQISTVCKQWRCLAKYWIQPPHYLYYHDHRYRIMGLADLLQVNTNPLYLHTIIDTFVYPVNSTAYCYHITTGTNQPVGNRL